MIENGLPLDGQGRPEEPRNEEEEKGEQTSVELVNEPAHNQTETKYKRE